MKSKKEVNIGRILDLIYWGDGSKEYPGLSISQIASFWGINKERAFEVKTKKLLEIPASWKNKYTLSVGGFRSGKTFIDIFKHLFKSFKYPKYSAMIVRKHHTQLRETYVKDFLLMIDRITEDNKELLIINEGYKAGAYIIETRGPSKTPSKFIFQIEPDGEFTQIRDSFKGYELAAFSLEEASELKEATWKVLRSRLSYKEGPTHGAMLSNPTFRGQWLAKYAQACEVDIMNGKGADCLIIRSETYENAHNLPDDYIPDLERQYENDPVGLAMALKGQDGVADVGRPVFINHWKDAHNIDASIKFNPYLPLIRGWDFGKRNAACGFWQFTKEGHAVKISELVIEDMYVEQFTDSVISHTILNYELGKAGIIDYGDFAGLQEKDTGSSIQRVREYTKGAINIQAKYFGDMDKGLNHIKKLLSTTVNGKFRLRFHPRCKFTIEAMKWGFFYKVLSDGRLASKPLDNEYMHMMDADRYAICNALPIEEERAAEWGKPVKAKSLLDQKKGRG